MNERFEIHTQLNPKLWTKEEKLKPQIRDRLLNVVKEFKDFCDIDFRILDCRIVGSNASYNYTYQSDLDLHIVVNFDSFNSEPELIQQLFSLEKTNFNNSYDIKIKSIPIEVYVEDVNSSVHSNGIYSVKKDKWIKHPTQIELSVPDTAKQLLEFQIKLEQALKSNKSSDIQEMIDSIYLLRKDGMDSEGEFSLNNQLFKDIRSLGYLDRLKDRFKELKSKELSLEGIKK